MEVWGCKLAAVDNTVVGIVSKLGGTVSAKFCVGVITCSQ